MKVSYIIASLLILPRVWGGEIPAAIREHYSSIERNVHELIEKADEVTVEYYERDVRTLLWRSNAPSEVRGRRSAIRVVPPKGESKTENGREVYVIPGLRCACVQGHIITLRAKGAPTLTLGIKHGKNAFIQGGDEFEMDEAAFRPFLALVSQRENRRANQTPEPTPGSVTPRATERLSR